MKCESFRLKKFLQYVNRFISCVASNLSKISSICLERFVGEDKQEDKQDGRYGQGREETCKGNGYDVSGWASVEFGHPDEDRGYGSHCRGAGSGGVSFGGGLGGSHL
jgi:hypothetical protein